MKASEKQNHLCLAVSVARKVSLCPKLQIVNALDGKMPAPFISWSPPAVMGSGLYLVTFSHYFLHIPLLNIGQRVYRNRSRYSIVPNTALNPDQTKSLLPFDPTHKKILENIRQSKIIFVAASKGSVATIKDLLLVSTTIFVCYSNKNMLLLRQQKCSSGYDWRSLSCS